MLNCFVIFWNIFSLVSCEKEDQMTTCCVPACFCLFPAVIYTYIGQCIWIWWRFIAKIQSQRSSVHKGGWVKKPQMIRVLLPRGKAWSKILLDTSDFSWTRDFIATPTMGKVLIKAFILMDMKQSKPKLQSQEKQGFISVFLFFPWWANGSYTQFKFLLNLQPVVLGCNCVFRRNRRYIQQPKENGLLPYRDAQSVCGQPLGTSTGTETSFCRVWLLFLFLLVVGWLVVVFLVVLVWFCLPWKKDTSDQTCWPFVLVVASGSCQGCHAM